MYTARNICAGIAIAYWAACIISSPPLHAANLSGQWQLEGEELHRFEHQKWAEYDNGNIIDTMEEDFVGVVDQPHFESQGYAVHSDGIIEGYLKRKRVCGEEFDYGFTGTVSEDNHVSLLIIYPGGSERCNLYGATWYLSYTDMIGYYDGVYDSLKGTITGTFTASQQRVYTECWDYDPWFGYDHYSVESTNIVTSGTFSITISGVDILDPPPTMVVYNPNIDSPEITFRAVGYPSGGRYHWEILRGEDKIRFVEGIDNAEVKLQAVRPSEIIGDTEIKVIYTVGSNTYEDTHSITIQKPTTLKMREDKKINPKRNLIEGGKFYEMTYFFQVVDQLGNEIKIEPTMSGMPFEEKLREYCIRPWWQLSGPIWATEAKGETDGSLEDHLIPPTYWKLPSDFCLKRNQEIYVAGWLVDERCQTYYCDYAISISGNCGGICESERRINFKESNKIYRDETHSHDIWVDSTISEITFNINWVGSNLDLILYAPSGEKIDPNVAENSSNIKYCQGDTYKYYNFENPEPGNWTMEITAIDVPPEGEDYLALAGITTNLTFSVSLNGTEFAQNDVIVITAELMEGSIPIIGALVMAEIERPDVSVDYILLYDDGMHRDEEPNDGIYANIYMDTALRGFYDITVSATGELSGEHYERTAFLSSLVSSIISGDIDFAEYSTFTNQ